MNYSNQVSEKINEILALRKKADELENALKLLFGNDVMSPKAEDKQVMPTLPLVSEGVLSGTFFDKVKTILSKKEEMKAKEIQSFFSGMADNSFSARLSTLVKAGKIKKRVVENASNSDKYFYHL